jgi:hypothetical protein
MLELLLLIYCVVVRKKEGMTDTEKHIEDIQKAINHLHFELDRIYDGTI